MSNSFAIFAPIERTVLNLIQQGAASTSGGWAGTMITLISSCVALYIIGLGYMTLAGKLKQPLNELLWKLASICLIIAFLDHSEGWMSLITGGFYELKGTLGGATVGSLDNYLNSAMDVFDEISRTEGKLYLFICEFILFWMGLLLFLMAAFLTIMINEITFIIALAFIPIAIASLSHPATKGIFTAWINILLSSMFTLMVASMLLKVLNGLFMQIMSRDTGGNYLILCVYIAILGICSGAFMGIAVSVGKALASASLDSAKEAIGANNKILNTKIPGLSKGNN